MHRCMGCMQQQNMPEGRCPSCGFIEGTPAREAYHLAPGGILQGRYIVGKVLGYGGFGVTYIGFDAQLERLVAIKEFLPTTFATRMPGDTLITVYRGEATAQFSTGLSRFVDEARTLAQFNGTPGIVDIYDTFSGNNTAYIVMEFLKGRDVKALMSEQGVMDYERARDIILKVCDTLAPVHAQNIIHRDISPDNIFLTDTGEVKLLDFGAARYESAVNSNSLSVILKSGYAPEEQYRSKGEQGPWTDVYALSATFYKMLTGQTPPDSMERAIADEIVEPSKLGAALPQSVENALLNALCVRKSDRTKSIPDFKAALLADGVARVKVKAQAQSGGKMGGGKIALVAGVALVLGLGLFAAFGGFGGGEDDPIILGGSKLEDNFGSADKEGFASVPSLSGLSLPEAEETLSALGLTLEVQGYSFSSRPLEGDTPLIGMQISTPGSQVEEGGAVQVQLSVGDPVSATQKGLISDPLDLNPLEALLFVEESTFSDGGDFSREEVFSDTVPAGQIVDILPHETDPWRYRVLMSVGSADVHDMAELRHAYMDSYGNIEVQGAADYRMVEENGHAFVVMHATVDGGAEFPAGFVRMSRRSLEDERYSEMIAANFTVEGLLELHREDYSGKDVRLRAEIYYFSEYVTLTLEEVLTRGELMGSMELMQTLRYDYLPMEGDFSVEPISYDEVQQMLEAGTLQDDGYYYALQEYLFFFEQYPPLTEEPPPSPLEGYSEEDFEEMSEEEYRALMQEVEIYHATYEQGPSVEEAPIALRISGPFAENDDGSIQLWLNQSDYHPRLSVQNGAAYFFGMPYSDITAEDFVALTFYRGGDIQMQPDGSVHIELMRPYFF